MEHMSLMEHLRLVEYLRNKKTPGSDGAAEVGGVPELDGALQPGGTSLA